LYDIAVSDSTISRITDEIMPIVKEWQERPLEEVEYHNISKLWRGDWATLSTYFMYPDKIRKIIYTTNSVEGFNRQLRKVTKNKSVFPSDDSLLKMLYLAAMDIIKKQTSSRQDWGKIRGQLMIFFEDRLANFK
jgi:transposase-like protein